MNNDTIMLQLNLREKFPNWKIPNEVVHKIWHVISQHMLLNIQQWHYIILLI